jgi:hypothetical protein
MLSASTCASSFMKATVSVARIATNQEKSYYLPTNHSATTPQKLSSNANDNIRQIRSDLLDLLDKSTTPLPMRCITHIHLELDRHPAFARHDLNRPRPLDLPFLVCDLATGNLWRVRSRRQNKMHAGDFGRVESVQLGEEFVKVILGDVSGDG